MKWKLTVIVACLTIVSAFLFVFRYRVTEPYFLSMPYILWTGLLLTAALVVLTYLGSRFFIHKDK